jgi:hypothetical protein
MSYLFACSGATVHRMQTQNSPQPQDPAIDPPGWAVTQVQNKDPAQQLAADQLRNVQGALCVFVLIAVGEFVYILLR